MLESAMAHYSNNHIGYMSTFKEGKGRKRASAPSTLSPPHPPLLVSLRRVPRNLLSATEREGGRLSQPLASATKYSCSHSRLKHNHYCQTGERSFKQAVPLPVCAAPQQPSVVAARWSSHERWPRPAAPSRAPAPPPARCAPSGGAEVEAEEVAVVGRACPCREFPPWAWGSPWSLLYHGC